MMARDFSEEMFCAIESDFRNFSKTLQILDLQFIPLSALEGDNVVQKSTRMSWYVGPTLLDILETVEVTSVVDENELRFPVQYVNRPNANFRGYAGVVAGGVVRPGQEVKILPSGKITRVKEIHTFDGIRSMAASPLSVTLILEDEIDISRGDVIVAASNTPTVTHILQAHVCWMVEDPLSPRQKLIIKHACKSVKAVVNAIHHRIDVNTLALAPAAELHLNDIALVEFKTTSPLVVDPYVKNRQTGSFILIDETTNNTVGAGMIV
jgi:sulfate adenylyltransferase subunit 1